MPMKTSLLLITILAAAACGGGKSAPATPKEPEPDQNAEAEKAPAPAPEPEPAPAPPPPPKSWKASAELTPVKGSKIKPATVTFAQEEGGETTIASTGWFTGLKAGKYHLVVHEAAECGANATKAGKATDKTVEFTAAKGTESLDAPKSATVSLGGDDTVIGHTLVLHDDKKGKPGKALACGPIAVVNE